MKLWEVGYSCSAHADKHFKFAAKDFEAAFAKAKEIIHAKGGVHGEHGNYTHVIIYLDYVSDFESL